MRYWLYDTALTLAAPIGAAYLAASPRHRSALARFSPRVPPFSASPLWVHACSVGEVGAALPVIATLQQRHPALPILLTTSTVTGRDRAIAANTRTSVAWFPFDHPFCVSQFLQRANPRALVLIETELWPNVLRKTARLGIPSVLINGRLSDRHFHRYQRLGKIARDMVSTLIAAGVQDEAYAQRFAELGLNPSRIEVTGNLKFDGVKNAVDQTARDAFRAECGIPPGAPILVFGSTRPGDETMAVECWRALRQEWPNLQLILAPRHIERVPELQKLFSEPVRLRTDQDSNRPEANAIIVDTHGELVQFYSIATAAVVGGSFDSAIQGHNPIEPAAIGVPTVYGPHMRNFAGAAESLTGASAAIQLKDRSQLKSNLESLLRDNTLRQTMGDRGRKVVASNRGALQKTIDLIEREAQITAPTKQPS